MAKEPKKSEAEPRSVAPAVQQSRAMSPFEEMERMMEGMFPRGWMRPFNWEWPAWTQGRLPFEGRMPKVDVIDREGEVVVKAELPGVDKKDLEVSMTDTSVTIKGTSSHEEKEEKGDYYRCEMSRGSFSRTVALPGEVDGAKAKARFKDGVLELTIPKLGKSRRRSVKVD